MRRPFIIAISILALVTIGTVAYYYFQSKAPAVTVTPPILLPGGQPIGTGTLPTTTETEAPPVAPVATAPARLAQVSKGPVVPGFIVLNTGAGTTSAQTLVSYLERQSGNVFSYNTSDGTLTRTSNRTIPGIQSALWTKDGSLAIVRYLSGDALATINTYAIHPDGSGGFFLPQNLADVTLASSSILTLSSGVNGSIVSSVTLDGARTATLFSSPLSSVRLGAFGCGKQLLFTKPSATLPGYAFSFSALKTPVRVAGPNRGLVALPSPLGSYVLLSYTQSSSLRLALLETKTGVVTELPVGTIADKCVWSADEKNVFCGVPQNPDSKYAYPDDWYQGVAAFSDRIWKLDVTNRYVEMVLDFTKSTGAGLDAKALAVDPRASTLVFMNKNDGSLWAYKL